MFKGVIFTVSTALVSAVSINKNLSMASALQEVPCLAKVDAAGVKPIWGKLKQF